MQKIKWIPLLAFFFATLFFLTACNNKDTVVPANNELLDSLEESEGALIYKTEEENQNEPLLQKVTKGNLLVEATQKVSLYYPEQVAIIYEEPIISSEIVEVFRSKDDLVEKGDVIASIKYKIDEIELLRLKLELSRKEEAFHGSSKEKEVELQQLKVKMEAEENSEVKKEIKSNYESLKTSYDAFRKEELMNLELLREEVTSYEAKNEIGYIYAPITGIISEVAQLKPGDLLYPNQEIGRINDTETTFLSIEDEKGIFRYNMEVELVVTNKGNTKDSPIEYYKGVIISGSNLVQNSLKQPIALIELIDGNIDDLRDKTIKATGKIKYMEEVLLVDKRTVNFDRKSPYVMEYMDGKVYKRNFINAGFDPYNYMIFKGLEEGMEVILLK